MRGGDRYWLRFIPHRPPGSSFWQTLVPRTFDVSVANLIEGLRAAVACAVPVYVSEALQYPELSWAAIAAFWVCLADPGGPVRVRLTTLVTFGVLGALSCATAIWATTVSFWLAVFLAFLWTFAGSFVRIFGDAAGKVGLFVLVTFLVSIGNFEGRSVGPGTAALLYLAGASWGLILTLVLWRIHPHGPSRRALATVYVELARFAAAFTTLFRAAAIEGDAWGPLARDHRRRFREALDSARSTITTIRRTRPGRSRRADQQLTLLRCADQIFAALIALSDLLETRRGASIEPALDTLTAARLDRVPDFLEALSAAVLANNRSLTPPLDGKFREIAALAGKTDSMGNMVAADCPPSLAVFSHLTETVYLGISSAANVTTDAQWEPGAGVLSEPFPDARGSLREVVFIPLAQNLNSNSVPLQHALRLAVTASIALLITFLFELGHGYWLTMTTVVILQPYAATTWQLLLKRIAGSVLGGILAAALGIVVHTPRAIALAIFPISGATMIFRTIDYGLYVLFLTPQFVLISALAEPGNGDFALSWLRAVNSVLGGILALAAGMLLWPGRELHRLPNGLAAAIAANREYLTKVFDARVQGGRHGPVDAFRRLAGLASNNAEASVQRLLSEPGNAPGVLEAAMTIVTSVRRLTGAVTVIALLPRESTTHHVMPGFDAVLAWIDDALWVMESAARGKTAAAALRERPEFPRAAMMQEDQPSHTLLAEAVARICRQIDIMHAALTRLAAPASSEPSMQV